MSHLDPFTGLWEVSGPWRRQLPHTRCRGAARATVRRYTRDDQTTAPWSVREVVKVHHATILPAGGVEPEVVHGADALAGAADGAVAVDELADGGVAAAEGVPVAAAARVRRQAPGRRHRPAAHPGRR